MSRVEGAEPVPSRVMKRSPSAAAFLARAATGATTRRHRKDAAIFTQGDPADAVFCVRSGQVVLRAVSRQGRAVVVARLGRGAFFGEGCLSGESVRHATARASVTSTVVRVGRGAMVALLRRQPRFRTLFTSHVLARHVQSEQELIDGLFVSSEKRLAGVLLTMSGMRKTAKGGFVSPGITEDGLALMLRAPRAEVRALMGRFRKMGVVTSIPGGLRVGGGLLGVVLHE